MMWRAGSEGLLARGINVSLDDMFGRTVYCKTRGPDAGAPRSQLGRFLGMLRLRQAADRKCLARKTI